jgi:hypothetical protein
VAGLHSVFGQVGTSTTPTVQLVVRDLDTPPPFFWPVTDAQLASRVAVMTTESGGICSIGGSIILLGVDIPAAEKAKLSTVIVKNGYYDPFHSRLIVDIDKKGNPTSVPRPGAFFAIDVAGLKAGVDPIYAAADGVVFFTGWTEALGWFIIVRHGGAEARFYTLYAHLAVASPLKIGTAVTHATPVGTFGNTGKGVGKNGHIHFAFLYGLFPAGASPSSWNTYLNAAEANTALKKVTINGKQIGNLKLKIPTGIPQTTALVDL